MAQAITIGLQRSGRNYQYQKRPSVISILADVKVNGIIRLNGETSTFRHHPITKHIAMSRIQSTLTAGKYLFMEKKPCQTFDFAETMLE